MHIRILIHSRRYIYALSHLRLLYLLDYLANTRLIFRTFNVSISIFFSPVIKFNKIFFELELDKARKRADV